MRAVLQRVRHARVTVAGRVTGEIGPGLLIFLGIHHADTPVDAAWLAAKTAALRIFEDDSGRMNRSLLDLVGVSAGTGSPAPAPPVRHSHSPKRIADLSSLPVPANPEPKTQNPLSPPGGPPVALVVSQFTLHASTRKGSRPSFHEAARPELARPLYDTFRRELAVALGDPVAAGEFGAMMEVELLNDGPVTVILDSASRD